MFAASYRPLRAFTSGIDGGDVMRTSWRDGFGTTLLTLACAAAIAAVLKV